MDGNRGRDSGPPASNMGSLSLNSISRAQVKLENKNTHDEAPNRFELFLLGEGEQKVTWKLDSRVPNTAIFTFAKEDHTLGNLLSSRLHKYSYVTFSAYVVAHPLIPNFDLRVGTDGSISPKDAVIQCCKDILLDLDVVSREFTKEMELKKIAGGN